MPRKPTSKKAIKKSIDTAVGNRSLGTKLAGGLEGQRVVKPDSAPRVAKRGQSGAESQTSTTRVSSRAHRGG